MGALHSMQRTWESTWLGPLLFPLPGCRIMLLIEYFWATKNRWDAGPSLAMRAWRCHASSSSFLLLSKGCAKIENSITVVETGAGCLQLKWGGHRNDPGNCATSFLAHCMRAALKERLVIFLLLQAHGPLRRLARRAAPKPSMKCAIQVQAL